jgi:hypothetical protein
MHVGLGHVAVLASMVSTPTPTPAANAQTSNIQPWLIAILSALLAAFLAILAQIFTTHSRDRKDLSYVRASVENEIAAIRSLCRERLQLPARRMVVVSPFPVSAWNALQLSPHRSRIPKYLINSWEAFYRLVEIANTEIAMVPFFIQVAALAAEPTTREDYLNEAITLARGHLNEIGSAVPDTQGSKAIGTSDVGK